MQTRHRVFHQKSLHSACPSEAACRPGFLRCRLALVHPAACLQREAASRVSAPYQQPQQQIQQLQQPQTANTLARRPVQAELQPNGAYRTQTVYIEMSQVVGKQVITRTTGRSLGVVSAMWVDPVRLEVVSLDLDDKKGVGSTRICNFPLSRLTQIGDVVLVHDEEVLYDQPMDGRYGYYLLTGMEVRTRSGEFLGKVRDFTFSPDSGTIDRVVYDDFGLSFLPVAFFDTYSLAMSDVISLGVGGLIVSEEARYRERRESPGLFAAVPSLLRTLNSGTGRVAGALTDGYRQDGAVAGYLPQGYSYAQWETDVRRWEQETGMSYNQYTRMMAQQQPQGQVQQQLLPSARPRTTAPQALPGLVGPGTSQMQQPQQQNRYPARNMQPQPSQQPQQYGAGGAQQPQQYGPRGAQQSQQSGAGGYNGVYNGQPQQQGYGYAAASGGQRGGPVDPRSRTGQPQPPMDGGRGRPDPGSAQQQQYGSGADRSGWAQPSQQQQSWQQPQPLSPQQLYAPAMGNGGPPQVQQQPPQQPPQQRQQPSGQPLAATSGTAAGQEKSPEPRESGWPVAGPGIE